MKNISKLRLIGSLTGFLSAGFGIGGGALLVPAYHSLAGYSFKQAAGNSLATIVPIVGIGLIGRLLFSPQISLDQLNLFFIIAVLLGAYTSTRFIGKLNCGNGLKALFGLFLILCGMRLAYSLNLISILLPSVISSHSGVSNLLIAAYGIIIGSISAMLGVGCGLAIVPLFLIVFNIPIDQAIFQSLATMFILTSFNAFAYKHIMNIDLQGARTALIPALAGASMGLLISTLMPSHMVKIIFGYLLLIIGIKYTFNAIKELIHASHLNTFSKKSL